MNITCIRDVEIKNYFPNSEDLKQKILEAMDYWIICFNIKKKAHLITSKNR